jgi:hypothetical protein
MVFILSDLQSTLQPGLSLIQLNNLTPNHQLQLTPYGAPELCVRAITGSCYESNYGIL